jgi:adenylate cyclase
MERRLTAILGADVVGYSRLMGADEAGTLTALQDMRTGFIDGKIAEHQGRVVKLTGDGILAEFPSVVSAVACAVELQRGIRERNADVPQDRRIEFRIGVNLGDSLSKEPTSTAMASMSQPVWKASPNRAESRFQVQSAIMSATG